MIEELKIIISAVTKEAKENIERVKKELKDVDKTSKETGKTVGASMKGIAKGAAAAVAVVTALVAAMTSLGKKAQDVEKGFSRLKATFESAGSNAASATASYKELFGILGDHDRAVESGQSLARITTDAKKLGEYYEIIAGAVSKYGDGYNAEALTENIAETIQSGAVVGDLERVLIEAGISVDGLNNSLSSLTTAEERELLVRSVLNGVLGSAGKLYLATNKATIEYNQSQANLNIALAQASAYTTPFLTSVNNLGTSLLTTLAPALEVVALYMTAFIELMAEAIQWVGSFFGLLGSSTDTTTADMNGYNQAMSNYLDAVHNNFGSSTEGAKGLGKEIEKLKKQTMGFDELNVVSSPTPAASGGSVGGGVGGVGNLPPIPKPEDFGIGGSNFESFKEDLEEAKEKLKVVLALVGAVAAAFLLWKAAGGVAFLITALREVGFSLSGLKAYTKGYYEALRGDGTWDKLKSRAGIFLIIAGAIALAAGFSDAWVNGVDWGNFATILGGIALIVGGLALSVSPLAAAIGLVVGGILLLVLGIKDLVTNGYSMEAVIMVAVGAITVLIGVIWALNAALLANPITWIVVAIMALVAAFVVLWNECEGFRNFWINLWEGIKKVTKIVVDAVAKFFVDLWEGIKKTFSSVGKWFSDVFQGAWNGIKKAFSAFGSFFSGLWDSIKKTFSKLGTSIGDAIGGAVKSGINGVISLIEKTINKAIKLINGGINLINKIPGVSIGKIGELTLPRLAKGGITTGATTALIGEAGREAVLPLENNTGWMDVLAERVANRSATPSRIVLMLDGRELGHATINSINSITKQTGELPLVIA